MTNTATDFDFDKLQALVNDWVIRYNHIAEISFFQVDDNKQPFRIELVLCDPPGIAPEWRDPLTIKDGFIKYGPDFLKQEIVKRVNPAIPPTKIERPGGPLYDYGKQAQNETGLADRWGVFIRWENDPSYFEHISTDNRKMLYSAPTVDSIDGIFRKFSAEDYEHFSRLSYFTETECLDLLIGFPISEKDILNPRVRLSKEAREKKIEALKWIQSWQTNVDRNKEILNRAIENDELQLLLRNKGVLAIDAGPFLEWAREKGFHIPITNAEPTDDFKTKDQDVQRKQQKQNGVTIKTPPGTAWHQIRIRYVNDDHVEISHPGIDTHSPYSMDDLGLDNKPMLSTAFKMFARYHGDIKPKNMENIKEVKANISNLRKHLKGLFPGIKGNPIKNYSPKDGYCCEFKITKS